MNIRNNELQKNDKESSTTKITSFLQAHNENDHQPINAPTPVNDWITKSYRPAKLPTEEEIEARYGERYREAVQKGEIRTDGHNLQWNEKQQMYFYLPKDHPEYKECPDPEYIEESYNFRNCTII